MDFPLFPIDTFPNGEKVFHFSEKQFWSVWRSTPFMGSLSVYVETKQG